MKFVVQCGLTRRLVEADDAHDALQTFLNDAPLRRHLSGAEDDTTVDPATDADIAEFHRGRRKNHPDQIALTLDDARKDKASSKSRGTKEHA